MISTVVRKEQVQGKLNHLLKSEHYANDQLQIFQNSYIIAVLGPEVPNEEFKNNTKKN